MSTFTFKWPKGPEEVILTGTFDNWSKSLFLVKQSDGSFELTVPLPAESGKLLYKYIVDGEWAVSQDEKTTNDDNGIENNFLDSSDLVSVKTNGGSKIPEAGGLVAASGVAAGIASAPTTSDKEVKTTVLPKLEPQQTTLGEPGVAILKGDELESAKNLPVNDIDAKQFNEDISAQISAEEKKKQKKKVKRSQYKAKKKKRAAEAAGLTGAGAAAGIGGAATTGTEESTEEFETTPEPEAKQAEEPTESVPVTSAKDVAPTESAPVESAKDFAPTKDVEPVEESKGSTDKAGAAAIGAAVVGGAIPAAAIASTHGESDAKPVTESLPVESKDIPETDAAPVPINAEASEPIATEPVVSKSADAEPTATEPVATKSADAPAAAVAGGAIPVAAAAAAAPVAANSAATKSADVEPTAAEPVATEPVATKSADAPAAAVAGGAIPAAGAAAPIAANSTAAEPTTVEPTAAEPIKDVKKDATGTTGLTPEDPGYHSLDPNSPAKEVTTTPGKPSQTDVDEIIIAQGKGKNIEQQILASEQGEVTLEEIQPTKSEKERLTTEANVIKETSAAKEPKETKPKSKPVVKPTKEDDKKDKKKKGGFISKLKKIFS